MCACASLSRKAHPLSCAHASGLCAGSHRLQPFSSAASLARLQIGHVDAGKSTLTGHLLHRLGLVSNKEMHKNRKEAAEKVSARG